MAVARKPRRPTSQDRARFLAIIDAARGGTTTGHDLVLTAMRRAILEGVLIPGQRLRQEELGEAFGTSRVPVREALRALEYEGLVQSVPHKGFTVASINLEDVEEVYDLRTVIEGHAVRLAIPLLTEEDLRDLEAAFRALQAAESPDDQLATRESFYRRLYSVTARPRLVGLIMRLHQEVARMLRWATVERSVTTHEEFFNAVRAGDADRAVEHLTEHYRRVAALLRRRIKESAHNDGAGFGS